MPKNAANKLINEEVRLPVATTNSTTIRDSIVYNNTTEKAEGFLLHASFKTTQTQNEKTSINNSSPLHTATTTTTKSPNHSQLQPQQRRDEDLNKFPSGGHQRQQQQHQDGKNFDGIASSTAAATTTTLYPTVIETSNKDTAVAATTTILSAGKSSHLIHNNNSSKVARKRKVKSWNLKITATENNRRATLRARKIVSDSGTTKTNSNKNTTAAAAAKEKSKSAAEQVQIKPIESSNRNATNKKTTCISGSTSVVCYLDAAVLNRIETLECEVKKGGNKRKRLNRAAAPSNKNNKASSRKSAVPVAAATQQQQPQKQTHSKPNFDFDFLPPNGGEQKENTATTNSSSADGSPIKKRPKSAMSLYERRYARDDGGRSSSSGGGVVSNGFLSSATTRNSSAASSATAETAADDIQSSSAAQYYMSSAASENASTIAAGVSGSLSASAANGSGMAPPSMATLCNIGNTCYLNSVVYTLRFAPQFLHNLHHLIVDLGNIQQNIVRQQRAKSSSLGRGGMSAMHMENARSWSSKDLASLEQYGAGGTATANAALSGNGSAASSAAAHISQKSSHQLLTERLHELYQSLHRNEATDSSEPFHADTLLHAIQDVSAIFEGNQQQDAHEFLMCVLNSIRETCQTLLKAIAECPDVILNGYISNPDEVDAAALEKDAALLAANSHVASSGGNGSSSSLSTSNIAKAYFFSRKSKRKEEGKNSKNTRLQSPLKDASGGSSSAVGLTQQQPTSNSLFYLNTVDLSGGSHNAQTAASSATAASTKATIGGGGGGGDEEATRSPSVVSLLKDKERLAAKIRELGLDFFTEDFEGITVSTTKCLSCETITEQKESMIDIAVPVPISGYDSADYTEKPCSFIQNSCITREYFRGENKYRCEKCTGYTEAIRSISYEVLPRLLVIQLSRFSGGMEKINSYIPTSFTLQCFCAKCCELSDANKLHIYKLYSVITHVGATMSVGHYIAYTSSLDYWANEYSNCPKDRRASQPTAQQQQQTPNGQLLQNNGNTTTASSAASVAASALASSGTSLIKKMKFGRSKASSSGDMSKNVKNLNGIAGSGGAITSKTITNGIGKLSMSSSSSSSSPPNTTCHSLSCCATRFCSVHQQQGSDLSEEAIQNGSNHANSSSNSYNNHPYPSGYGSSGRGGSSKNSYSSCANINASGSAASAAALSSSSSSSAEPIWYMCDDDKIKAMTQREFEELLSPSRKITITPYLLFYCKFDLQPTSMPPKSVLLPSQTAAAAWQQPSEVSSGGGSLLKM